MKIKKLKQLQYNFRKFELVSKKFLNQGVGGNARLGFTLIELLVVISIISLLSSIVFSSLSSARESGRDTVRLSDMRTIQTALQQFYLDNNGRYPEEHEGESGGSWEGSNEDDGGFLDILVANNYLPSNIIDPINDGNFHYAYHRYTAGDNGCLSGRGAFYVLGIRRSEKHKDFTNMSQNPGWSCPNRNWQNEFAWVTGSFEN